MKKNILLQLIAILLLYCFSGYSQTTITYAKHAPKVGYFSIEIDSFDVFDGIDIDPGEAGPSRNWDFSEYTASDETKWSFTNPGSTPFADELAGTEINIVTVIEDIEGEGEIINSYAFIELSNNELVIRGFSFGEEIYYYDPSATAMIYPFSYGNKFSSYSESDVFQEEFNYRSITKSWIEVEADAWGSIKTPSGTFSNVLRLKSTERDSLWIYFEEELVSESESITVNYHWYSPEHRTQVFRLHTFVDEEDSYPYLYSYMKSSSTSTAKIPEINSLIIYPNPAAEQIFIRHDDKDVITTVRLSDVTGCVMIEKNIKPGSAETKLDISAAKSGIYIIQALNQGQLVATEKLIIK